MEKRCRRIAKDEVETMINGPRLEKRWTDKGGERAFADKGERWVELAEKRWESRKLDREWDERWTLKESERRMSEFCLLQIPTSQTELIIEASLRCSGWNALKRPADRFCSVEWKLQEVVTFTPPTPPTHLCPCVKIFLYNLHNNI